MSATRDFSTCPLLSAQHTNALYDSESDMFNVWRIFFRSSNVWGIWVAWGRFDLSLNMMKFEYIQQQVLLGQGGLRQFPARQPTEIYGKATRKGHWNSMKRAMFLCFPLQGDAFAATAQQRCFSGQCRSKLGEPREGCAEVLSMLFSLLDW